MSKSGHEVTHLSGTDKSALQTGTYTAGSEKAIFRDIKAGKLKADKIGKMDIDEMVRSLQVFRDNPSELRNTGDENRQAYVKVIETAMADPIIGAKLEERHVRMLEAMKVYLDPNKPNPADDAALAAIAGRNIPHNYDLLTIFAINSI